MDDLQERIEGRWVEVPKELLEQVHGEGWRLEKTEACLLIWVAISTRTYSGKWRTIPNKIFRQIVPSNSTKTAVKKWLELHNWIEVEKWTAKDGRIRDKVLPGKLSKRYRAKGTEEIKEGCRLHRLSSLSIYPTGTQDDPLCISTRRILRGLKLQKERIKENQTVIEADKGPLLHSITKLHNGLGSVRRGRKVKRLYSPWVGCKSIGRGFFKLHGEDLIGFDLRASQPTIIGTLSGDVGFLKDCCSGKFYSDIGELLEVERKEAKQACYAYAFGPNRSNKTKNKEALAVQELIQKNYPDVHRFVWNQKLGDYRRFARLLQDKEAGIFLDKIFKELIQKDIPALTVHDSIYLISSHKEEGLEVITKHLDDAVPGGIYQLN